jgi:hypothetical protein|tara:strand:- start:550 stop:762 length:213 start_codon:yes stop_codon:yes gene_type:complete
MEDKNQEPIEETTQAIEEVTLEVGDVKLHSFAGLPQAKEILFDILANENVQLYLMESKAKKINGSPSYAG